MKTTDKNDSVYAEMEHILDLYLALNNHRRTPERYTILKAICHMDGHFSIDDLGRRLEDDYHFRVSRATLYNTLNLFLSLRLVLRHRFQGRTMYEACLRGHGHCHQTCTVCGKVTEVRAADIENAINELHLRRFRKDGFTLYIYGICSSCQATITKQRNKEKRQK